jgi:hypothetical protein
MKGTSPIGGYLANGSRYVGSGRFGTSGQRLIQQDSLNGGRITWVPLNDPSQVNATIGSTGLDAGGFKAVGVADFDADGIDDILFRSSTTGAIVVWHMNANGTLKSGKTGPTYPDQDWQIVGAGNINNAGVTDIVWHHTPTGTVYAWFMADGGNAYTAPIGATIGNIASATHELEDVGDFDGDGDGDILARVKATNAAQILKTQSSALLAPIDLASQSPVNGNAWTPEVLISAPVEQSAPIADGGSNVGAAKNLGPIVAAASQAPANLSYSQSSSLYGTPDPANMADGTMNAAVWTQYGSSEWIEASFDTALISGVEIGNADGDHLPAGYGPLSVYQNQSKVQAWINGAWVDVKQVSGVTATGAIRTFSWTPVTTNKIRILNSSYNGVTEFRPIVAAASQAPANLSYSQSSSLYGTADPANMADSTMNAAVWTQYGSSEWIEASFDTALISGVEIGNADGDHLPAGYGPLSVYQNQSKIQAWVNGA